MVIYLAGNITGLSKKDFSSWRTVAREYLENLGHKTLDPCRGKKSQIRYDDHEIVERDLKDINESDMILATMDFPGIGTSMEIIYAKHVRGIPVIVVSSDKKVLNHYWVKYFATMRFDKMDDALDYIKDFWNF